jgi:streptomycin 6-kinase
VDIVARKLAARWNFAPEEELPGGHCSRVYADARRVLKVPFQGEEMGSGYVAAMRMSGTIGPTVYQGDPDTGSILMERLIPGDKLATAPEDIGIEVISGLIPSIQGLPTEGCMPLADYVGNDPLALELLESSPEPTFLHGDLHQENVLRHGDSWVAIDPKGLVGDPHFEPTAFLRNPIDRLPELSGVEELLIRRIRAFCQLLSLDPWRVCAWSLVDVKSFSGTRWQPVVYALESILATLPKY